MRFKLLVPAGILAFGCVLYAYEGRSGANYYDYNHLKRFSEVRDLVQREYVREVSNEEIMEGAIKGMLQALDPHSGFLNPEEFSEMHDVTSGEFSGIGVEISTENGRVTVVTPIDDTPAHAAGILSGDL
ncbi:MAG: peptidase S41, partial [Deltaproteobacteria bacterium]|nr:peptidase S41 [Deltaproteobacteria bacterium]